MEFDDVVKVVEGTIQEGLQERTLWYSTKYDQKILLPLQRDEDVEKLVKGNDEYGYMYIGEKDVPIWKSMEVGNVDGNLRHTCCGGQRSAGCAHEKSAAFSNGSRTSVLAIMIR